MKKKHDRHGQSRSDRRQWLLAGVRSAALAALAALAGHVYLKSRRAECLAASDCRSCSLERSCGLPAAVDFRRKAGGPLR